MTKEELQEFVPRKSGVIVRENRKSKSSIILLDAKDADTYRYTYFVFAKGPKVEELEVGEEVFPMAGMLADLHIEGLDDNESFYYCEESFIKLRKITGV